MVGVLGAGFGIQDSGFGGQGALLSIGVLDFVRVLVRVIENRRLRPIPSITITITRTSTNWSSLHAYSQILWIEGGLLGRFYT